jgi:hypothetical protein
MDRESINNGSIYKMVCKCGWTINLRNNSGLPLGMKIAWWNHFYSLYPSLPKIKNIENNDVEVEFPNCVKCDNLAVVLVEKEWKSTNKEIINVCNDHIKEYDNFPGFKLININSWDKPNFLIKSAPIPEILEKKVDKSNSQKPDPIHEQKNENKTLKRVSILAILIIIGIALNNYDTNQSKKIAIDNLNTRNEMAKTCFSIEGEDSIAKSGPVGSSIRQSNTVYYYESIIKSPCVVWGDGSIFKNAFYNANKNSINWQQLVNAFNYTAKRWNGVEPYYLQCADGWPSPSIGKRGACSHHGGVVSPFVDNSSWNLVNQFKSAEILYPALAEMTLKTR